MFANEILGHNNLAITTQVMKKTLTLLKVAVLLILLVFNKQAKDKKLALSTEVKQKIAATVAMQQQPATAGVFLPFVNSGVISLAE